MKRKKDSLLSGFRIGLTIEHLNYIELLLRIFLSKCGICVFLKSAHWLQPAYCLMTRGQPVHLHLLSDVINSFSQLFLIFIWFISKTFPNRPFAFHFDNKSSTNSSYSCDVISEVWFLQLWCRCCTEQTLFSFCSIDQLPYVETKQNKDGGVRALCNTVGKPTPHQLQLSNWGWVLCLRLSLLICLKARYFKQSLYICVLLSLSKCGFMLSQT